ncbi:hypothetical protein [Parabacteroides pacaensis]|uniref:hypothetical protein n=1 Tax=Parabacteroides pacaensis TaxID=2086575 RepID=UPI00131E5B08|nr:hypothetical protein [Parabacteroides pacaensis]
MISLIQILTRENENEKNLFLYFDNYSWKAYGQSARLLSKYFPQMEKIKVFYNDMPKNIECIHIDEQCMLEIMKEAQIILDDDWVQIKYAN